jgi:uncharacterized protein (DUF433 family)
MLTQNIMEDMRLEEAVSRDPSMVSGALCFRGTRVPVSTLWTHIDKSNLEDFYEDFPGVSPEMVQAVFDEEIRQR